MDFMDFLNCYNFYGWYSLSSPLLTLRVNHYSFCSKGTLQIKYFWSTTKVQIKHLTYPHSSEADEHYLSVARARHKHFVNTLQIKYN